MSFFRRLSATFQQQGRMAQIIIINVAVFLTVNISIHILHLPLLRYLALPVGGSSFLYKFWTLVTYMFTHASLGHVFFNMLLFYFSAQMFYSIFGEKKLLYVYCMSGFCGAALLLVSGLLFPGSFSHSILLGASAAVMGVVMVLAVYAPNYTVALWGIVQMPYKYFAMLTFLLSTVVDFSLNTGGKISHIGGAVFGLAYGYSLRKGIDLFNFGFFSRRKSRLKIVTYNKTKDDIYNEKRVSKEARMNELLDKISKSGYDSLTRGEKEELFNLSQKK